ncbi:MAG: exodeoxyribonuclease VII small subunit [Pirellula sp.]
MAKSKANIDANNDAKSDDESMSFEGAMTQLEQIVRKLESGTLPLEEMLADYAKAVEYVQKCHTQLDGARRRIAQLQSVREDGKAVVKAWDDTAPQVSEGNEAPSRRRGSHGAS